MKIDVVREQLCQIIQNNGGPSFCIESKRIEGLLKDLCHGHTGQIKILILALNEKITDFLLNPNNPYDIIFNTLVEKLKHDVCMEEEAAKWAIESWALALSIIDEYDIKFNNYKSQKTNSTTISCTNQSVTLTNSTIVVSKLRGDYKTLTEAVANAPEGAIIHVKEGKYYESINIDKSLEIIGDGEVDEIIIESENSECFTISSDQVIIKGLSIISSISSANDAVSNAINALNSHLKLENCKIHSATSSAIYSSGKNSDTVIKKCSISCEHDNGLWLNDYASVRIEDCEIYACGGHGIALTNGSKATIKKSKITKNSDGGILVSHNSSLHADSTTSKNNKFGIIVNSGSAITITNCLITNNKDTGVIIFDRCKADIKKSEISTNQFASLSFSESLDISIYKCKIHTNKNFGVLSKRSNFKIQDCELHSSVEIGILMTENSISTITDSEIYNNKEAGIIVCDDSYTEIENCKIYCNQGPNILLMGSAKSVVKISKIYQSSFVGLLFANNGQGQLLDCEIYHNDLAGILISQNGSPDIEKCKIFNNKHYGLYFSKNGQGIINNCKIFENSSSEIRISHNSFPTINDCEITSINGTAVWIEENSDCKIENSFIKAPESMPAVALGKKSNPSVKKCKISGGQYGILFYDSAKGKIEECIITESKLCGIEIRTSNPIIESCKIFNIIGNKSTGIYIRNSNQTQITGCTICDITLNGIAIIQSTPIIERSNISNSSVGIFLNEKSNGEIKKCHIFNHNFAGIVLGNGSNPHIFRCKVSAIEKNGILIFNQAAGIIEECLICNNNLNGIEIKKSGNPELIKCKITNNDYRGIYVFAEGTGVVKNCNLDGNPNGSVYIETGSSLDIINENVN